MFDAPDRPAWSVAFTPAVQEAQRQRGSRPAIERMLGRRDFGRQLGPVAPFIAERDSAYLATASADGQPYIQHRGGPPGFLVVLDDHRLAFADYAGNRHYISVGNLSENDRVSLFLMDYPHRARLKLWGRATVVEEPGAEFAAVLAASPGRRVERVIVVEIEAWDWNCPQHITPRYTAEQWAELAG